MSKRISSLHLIPDSPTVRFFFAGGGVEDRQVSRRHYERLVCLWHRVSRCYRADRKLNASFPRLSSGVYCLGLTRRKVEDRRFGE